MNRLFILIFISTLCVIYSCSEKTDKVENSTSKATYEDLDANADNQDESEENSVEGSGCKYDDGTYSASVDYYNPVTGYSATYNLDVEVQECQIVQINFPNDGYLDEDHISYADIDENGEATVLGEEGKTYNITID